MDASLEPVCRRAYRVYTCLRASPGLAGESVTARVLSRGERAFVDRRLRDEMQELADALAGTHGHPVKEEATQVWYWLVLAAVLEGEAYDDLRPDLALAEGAASGASAEEAEDALRRLAEAPDPARAEAFRAVGAAAVAGGASPRDVVERDLALMRGKPYLAAFLAGGVGEAGA